jgi:hypothetical protein
MERFPVELIYLVVFAGFVLFNWLAQQATQRRQQEEQARAGEPAQEPDEPPPFEAEPDPPEFNNWGRRPAAGPAPAPAPVPDARPSLAAPSVARRPHPVRELLKGRSDLRRAVILAMVLGPCLAQEPPGEGKRPGSRQ